MISSLYLALILSFLNLPSSSNGSVAWAIIYLSSTSADINSIMSVTFPVSLSTFLYGVSTKPYSLICAKQESADIRPMFGPSGDSTGHNLP